MSDENKSSLTNTLPDDLTEEERRRVEKYSRIEQNKAKRTAIVASVTAFLILLFVGGVVGGAIYLSSYEAPQSLPDERTCFAPLPEQPDEIYSQLISLVPGLDSIKSTKLSAGTDVSISKDFTVESDREYLKNEIALIRESVASELSEGEANYNTSFGEDFTEKLPGLSFDVDNASSVTCADEPEEDNTSKVWRNYTFDFPGADFDEAVSNDSLDVFGLQQAKTAFEEFESSLSGMLTVTDGSIHCDTLQIYARADSYTGVLDYILLKRVYTVTVSVSFTGDYEAVGSDTFAFTVESAEKYSFGYVGLNIGSDSIFTEKGKSDEITCSVSTDEPPNEVVIEWSSSNPDVLTVDEEGYFKAHKISAEPVTVTARYTYLGIEYTDTCTVYVRKPASSVKVSEQQISVKAGESKTVSAAVEPENATFTALYWFSEDEAIATVDKETGEITALSPGTVIIYCITLDGNFRDSCELTVTQ